MSKIVYILCLSLSFIYAPFASSKLAHKTIVIPHNQYGLTPALDVYIGNKGPFKFIIDTGSSFTTISRSLADEVGLKYREQTNSAVLTIKDLIYQDITDSVDLYISDQKVYRQTNLLVTDHDFNSLVNAQGILGISQMQNGVLENNVEEKYLTLTLPVNGAPCDISNQNSKCHIVHDEALFYKFSLGNHTGELLVDTGYQTDKSILLNKSAYANEIWNQHHKTLPDVNKVSLSDKPLKRLKTSNFSLNGENCIGDILLRNPNDKSSTFKNLSGIIGWSVLSSTPFKLDFKNNLASIDSSHCPYNNVKTIGVNGIYTSKDARYMYVKDLTKGSPADKAGIKSGDAVEKVILSNKNILTRFDKTIFKWNNQHVYAPPGSQVTYFIRRNGELKPYTMTAEEVTLTEIK